MEKIKNRIGRVALWLLDHMAGTYISILIVAGGSAFAASTYNVYNVPDMFLYTQINSTQTSGIKLTGPIRNGTVVSYPALSGGVIELRHGSNVEHIYYSRAIVDSTTKVVTLTGSIIRDVCWNEATSYLGCGSGVGFPRSAQARLVNDARLYNLSFHVDRANRCSASGCIQFTGSGSLGVPYFATTADRDRQLGATPSGDKGFSCVAATGACYYAGGGTWNQIGNTGTSNATTTTAGKVELATVADQQAFTLLGDSGAPTVLQSSLLTLSGGLAQVGRVPIVSRLGMITGSLLATGNQYANGGRTYPSGTGGWIAMPSVGNVFHQCNTATGSSVISGTASETVLKACNLTGSLLAANDYIDINYSFISKNLGGSNSATVKLRLDSTTILTLGPINPVNNTPYTYAGTTRIYFRSVGSVTQMVIYGDLQSTSTGSSTITRTHGGPSPLNPITTYDFTTNPSLVISGTMGSSTAGNTMQLLSFSIVKNANPTQVR